MDKQALREWVWQEFETRGITTFPKPARGRIPNFVGSSAAATLLRSLPTYAQARTIFVNPDAAQLAVRELALRDGKRLIMATPRLREGFILLDPAGVKDAKGAASIRGAFKHGEKISVHDMKVDFIVEGSVAVDERGGRMGKGSGWGDIEYGILRECKAANEKTPIATTVHDVQIVPLVPMVPHDIPVDVIATPTRLIFTKTNYSRPAGIMWEKLENSKIKDIPPLRELKGV